MGSINTHLLQARKRCEVENGKYAEQKPPDELLPVLETFVEQAEQWLVRNLQTPFREALLDLYFAVNWFVRVAEGYDEHYATCTEKTDKDLRLKLFCLDPSEKLREALTRCQSVIFFSATMTPIGYFQQIFGCEPTARSRVLPSPFPKDHLCLLIANRISTLYKHRQHTIPEVTQAILTLVRQKQGNYLLFFPSYQYMRMIHEAFTDQSPETDVIIQTPGMREDEREQFLNRFAHDNPETLVGFAVMGGIFGEGIDLVGDRLTGAVIVGVGLPGICLERDLIRDYFARVNDSGFEFAYMYPGINRVLQAAGRVIRTETDRGVVLLIDRRFATSRYRTLFPREWQPVNVHDPQQSGQIVQQFWKR
jgi:DNA excision repair protein ERCC-2